MNDAELHPMDATSHSLSNTPLHNYAAVHESTSARSVISQSSTLSIGMMENLKVLFAVEWELTELASLDELCRRAIELGCSRLGFDRLSLWFFDAQPGVMHGTFGTDEKGQVRDERHMRLATLADIDTQAFLENREPLFFLEDAALRDERSEVIGRGQIATAALWDGKSALGILSADNLLSGQPFSQHQKEILVVYASIIGFLCSRRRAEQERQEREVMYRQAISSANGVVYQLDFRNKSYTHLDEGVERLLGYRAEEVTPLLWSQIGKLLRLHGELAGYTTAEATRKFRAGEIGVWTADYVCRTKLGEFCWISDSSIPLRDAEGNVYGCLGILQDITNRILSERALLESEERFRAAVTGSSDGLYDADLTTGDVYYSPRFLELLGYEEQPEELSTRLIGFERILHPDDQERAERQLEASLNTGVPFRGEYRIRTRSGEYRWFQLRSDVLRDENDRPVRLAGFLTDITESKRMQEQLLQAQKMESIGRLAGGVAHDFNNLLTAIMGYADLAKASSLDNSEQAVYLDNITHAGERAADLTRQLLAFASKQIIAPETLDLNAILMDTQRILRRLIGEHIDLVTSPSLETLLVRADPGQIQQILVNLVVNARDAMPEGGTLTLTTALVTLDATLARRHLDLLPGTYVMLTVSDTGHGMDETVQRHVFEPFFTTKEQGKGTGLGLATCHGIVKQNGGHIWVQSAPGIGTTFTIYLPQASGQLPLQNPNSTPAVPCGSETILLVEDDTLLCNFVRETLQEKGYHVLAASRGEEALKIAREHPAKIHLLITDVVMPQMSGAVLSSHMEKLRADTKVLYISGYTDDAIVQQGVLSQGVNFLQKPFSARSIANKVRVVLDGTDSASISSSQ